MHLPDACYCATVDTPPITAARRPSADTPFDSSASERRTGVGGAFELRHRPSELCVRSTVPPRKELEFFR
ncbi:unnamed protein product [Calypogeia fissa]